MTATTKIIGATKVKDIQIPKLVGLTQEEAKQLAESQGFGFEVKEEKYDAEIEAGIIISQDPEYKANFTIKEGTNIGVVVSLGQQMTIVPKVEGKEKEEAITLLEEALLEYEIEEKNDEKLEAGYVLEQSLEPEEEVSAGSVVKLTVSLGPEKTIVTNVQGLTEEKAKKALEDLGLEVEIFEKEDASKDNGIVLNQSIDAGTEVKKGEKITITVNKLPEEKEGTIRVNLKSIMGENATTTETAVDEETGGETTVEIAKTVTLEIFIDGDRVYGPTEVKATETAIKKTITRTGNVKVKIKVDGTVEYEGTFSYDKDSMTIE